MSNFVILKEFMINCSCEDDSCKRQLELIKYNSCIRIYAYDGKGQLIGIELSKPNVKELIELLSNDEGVN